MTEVGIRALKQNASSVVASAVAGDTVWITDRGRPVAQLTALSPSPLTRLAEAGRLRPPRISFAALGEPVVAEGLSAALSASRDAERF